jgi:MFS family permease
MADQRWCDVHQRWCSTDTARAGLLDDQQPVPTQPSKNFALPPFRRFNHNVVVTWLMTVVQGSADSIWSNTVLASYVYELMAKTSTPNTYAGYVEAAQGLANLIVALPVGWAADKGSKSRIVALGGLLIPVAVALTSYAVIRGVDDAEADDDADRFACFGVFLAAMCLWGVVQAISSGPAQALYADSTPQGQRSTYYTVLFIVSRVVVSIAIAPHLLHGALRPKPKPNPNPEPEPEPEPDPSPSASASPKPNLSPSPCPD